MKKITIYEFQLRHIFRFMTISGLFPKYELFALLLIKPIINDLEELKDWEFLNQIAKEEWDSNNK